MNSQRLFDNAKRMDSMSLKNSTADTQTLTQTQISSSHSLSPKTRMRSRVRPFWSNQVKSWRTPDKEMIFHCSFLSVFLFFVSYCRLVTSSSTNSDHRYYVKSWVLGSSKRRHRIEDSPTERLHLEATNQAHVHKATSSPECSCRRNRWSCP